MTQDLTNRCNCTNCPGANCQCGCQTAKSASVPMALPAACACGAHCACDAAEQGCVCH
jgi:hypothetical protein